MRIVFMGTPEFAVPALRAIIEAGHQAPAVYTRAPRPAGRRGLEMTKSPIHEFAEGVGLPVLTPATLRDEAAQAHFASLHADLGVVVAYGLLLPRPILQGPVFGCLNVHASLLPRWRGAAPIQRAIMAGDVETGVDLMRMSEGLDTGPIGLRARTPIRPTDTAGDLARILSHSAARLLMRALAGLAEGGLTFAPQSDVGATYARKIEKSETEIDWRLDAIAVRNHVHGLSPAPGAFSEIAITGRLERVKVLRTEALDRSGEAGAILDDTLTVACGRGALRILEAQRPGKAIMSGALLQRGAQIAPGAIFMSPHARSSAPSARA
jgi:methionyl-tRNA formyltransferase